MAISKIKPIRTTLNYAIDYIINPIKTEGGRFVSSFGCTPKTADLEMAITAGKGSNHGNRIAYHMIQSFAKDDDISPEKAHELGMEFAKKVTRGRHEFVVSTHIDGNCIHNHIIFNAVNFIDFNKYDNTNKELRQMRDINDEICRENKLSVIEKNSGKRGKSKYEYEQNRKNNSWKEKLRVAIDSAINSSSTFDEFIQVMELEGYEIKFGKHITFRATNDGQERFTRGKRLGEAYTEESIKSRIENKEKEINVDNQNIEKNKNYEISTKEKKVQKDKKSTVNISRNSKINLIVDISKNAKAQKSKGYEHALVRANIDTLAQTMNFLISQNLKTPEDFEQHYLDVETEFKFLMKCNKNISNDILDLSEKIKFTQNYKKYKYTYMQSTKIKNKQEFYYQHEQEIVQYKAAIMYFERNNINPDSVNLSQLFEDYKVLKIEKNKNDELIKSNKERIYDLEIIKKNLESSLNLKFEKLEKEKTTEKDKNRNEQNIGE